ncbi:hypothetical protein [Nocardia sp. NPDC051570]|uniref:hypothetical protein n=1 Tax=Nocardia sp. NPDC051570 TaxID=3364324 RepID=UPI0037BB9BC0
MKNAVLINLRAVRETDARNHLTGPLGRIRLPRLQPGERETLVADTQEHTLFTVQGTGTAVTGSATVPLHHGVALTLPLGSSVTVEAGTDGLEVFIASLDTPQRSADAS